MARFNELAGEKRLGEGGRTIIEDRAIFSSPFATLTVVTEGDGVEPEPRTVRLDLDAALRVYEAWSAADGAVTSHEAAATSDPPGLPTSFALEGRLVLAHKPVGAWPEQREVRVRVPGVTL